MLVKEIKPEELVANDSFFNELRNGDYVLVLGAGFSYGIPNRSGGTIPVVKEFVALSNKKFNISLDLSDFNTAADAWQRYIEEGNLSVFERKERFEEFKNLFLVDKDKFEYKKALFSCILIPKWSHIYTFNFDNVLDLLILDKGLNYEVQYYEAGSFSPANKRGIGYLHNSILRSESIGDLVFTRYQYAEKILEKGKDNHLYYALLNDIKIHKKNLFIIGCQFNEETIYTYLLNKERGIREDLKIINISFNSKPNYGFEIENVLKNNYWINCSAESFLTFLQENKHKLIDLSLDGADVINYSFIDKIKKGAVFSKAQFYSAKQDDHCQWYGILNGYDIFRKDYETIKNAVLNAFSIVSISKVAAIIHGTGGSGKSTVLRRLAIEVSEALQDAEVIWVKDRSLKEFKKNALPKIKEDKDHKFIVFIEDWYRQTFGEENKIIGDELLKDTHTINNLRLVIGDRDIKGKDYLQNVIKSEATFELKEEENKVIIKEIISNYVEWERVSNMVLKNEEIYNLPLFLILFAIAGVSENRFDYEDASINNLKNIVQRIAKYDLNEIAKHNSGLSKALYYWSCVYDKYKIYISYGTFLKLADYFNGNDETSKYYENWSLESKVLDKVKLYINVSLNEKLAGRFRMTNLVQFNHDKLAETILSKIELEGWPSYDDVLKKQLLNIITEKGDDYSAAVFLNVMILSEPQSFNDDKEKNRT
jgi:hypothetical protein